MGFRLQKALELRASATFNVLEMDREEIARAIAERFGDVDVVFETMGENRTPG